MGKGERRTGKLYLVEGEKMMSWKERGGERERKEEGRKKEGKKKKGERR